MSKVVLLTTMHLDINTVRITVKQFNILWTLSTGNSHVGYEYCITGKVIF